MSFLKLDGQWPTHDEVPWCSAFVNYVAWLLRLPRSKSLSARSWLKVGTPTDIEFAEPGFDVAILSRGSAPPGPEVLNAPGHVGFFAGLAAGAGIRPSAPIEPPGRILLLGGNQSDSVNVSGFPIDRLLGIRRLR
jgi:uncharacterized protein (TIGR02594 family)